MRRSLLGAFAAVLVLAAPAAAQSPSGPARPVSATAWPASVTGEISVSFRSDPSTGCAARAACGYQGTIAWTPGGGGSLGFARGKVGGRTRTSALLLLGEGPSGVGSVTAADVQRLGGAACADEQADGPWPRAVAHGDRVTVTLGGVLSPTRCAGPLPSDLARALPRATISLAALRRPGARLDFRTQRSFASHGFAGTLISNLVIRLGRPHPVDFTGPVLSGAPTRRVRVVTEALQVTGATGQLSANISGTTNPDVCVLLDSCGLAGTMKVSPAPGASHGELTAIGPATRPDRDYLAALGRSRTGRAAGLTVFGVVSWSEHGTAQADFRQGAECSDTVRLGPGGAILTANGRRLYVAYLTPGGLVGEGTALRTRCPGPDLAQAAPMAAGRAPRADLARRRFAVPVRAEGSVTDEGYDVALGGRLILGFRAGRVTRHTETEPAG